MKYEEIIGLYEYFQPVVDITGDRDNYWKMFIPTEDFLKVLRKFLSALDSNPKNLERKSIWIEGPYGTGKSHATSVIKHLLWDPIENIEDYLEKINDTQLRERLRNFRKEKRVFPVVLKGVSGIDDSKSLSLTIEKAVENALKRENIEVYTESEFEKYIKSIEEKDHINYEVIIEKNWELKAKVGNKEGLLKALKRRDVEVLKTLERSIDFSLPHPVIEDWLIEVLKELKSKGIYALAIYWDEFTSLLELISVSSILNTIQNIAEKTFTDNLFLYIVSHRNPQQTSLSQKDYEKLLGRFNYERYSIENITTFHIVSNALKKKNEEKWKDLRKEVFEKRPKIKNVILNISEGDNSLTNSLENIFPIHPYSALIATSISRYLGSSERSIFTFLYDEEKGFRKFIKEYPKKRENGEEFFLTPDILWDFFLSDFERKSSEKINFILTKYKQLEEKVKEMGESHFATFKGILLLNILYSLTETPVEEIPLFSPSEENISNMFAGTTIEEDISNILDDIDKENLIPKNPDGLFLISYSALPLSEIEEEKKNIIKEYEDITKLLLMKKKYWVQDLTSNVLRETTIKIYWAGIKEYELKRRLKNDFTIPYSISIALFIGKNEGEISEIKNNIGEILKNGEGNTDNIIFAISKTPLSEEEYKRLIDYLARARVAEKHQYNDEAETYNGYVEKILEQWVKRIKEGYFEIYFKDSSKTILGRNFYDYLNNEASCKIFKAGLENIKNLTNINVWKKQRSVKVLEIFISSQNRDDLEERTKNAPYKDLRAILMDEEGNYIVDKKLELLPNADPNHPLYKICKDVRTEILKYEGKTFNLGEALKFLQEPPYGLYPNMVNYAVLAFAMRPFVDKLYEEGTGRKIDINLLKEKLSSLFSYWEDRKNREKLNLRLGTKEEIELIKILLELFDLEEEEENLTNARWKVRKWIKERGYPIWSLKSYVKDKEEISIAIDTIFNLTNTPDKEIKEEDIKKSFQLLSSVKNDLKPLLSSQKLREGFKEWIEEKLKRKISEEEFDSIMEFLKREMQEEVGLWEDGKVELKLKDWENYRRREKAERDFISLLSRIFRLKSINDLQDLKEGIRNKINDLGLPLWTLKYVYNIESIRKAVEDIENFIQKDIPLNSEILAEFFGDIAPYESHITSSINIAKEGLKTWLREKHQKDLDSDSFLSYLKNRSKKEVYLWEEKDLEEILKEYTILKNLEEIFNIGKASSIEDLKTKIRNKIENLSYPFWTLELMEDGERTFNKIKDFVNYSYNLSLKDLEDILNNISKEKVKDLLEENKLKELFIKWLNTFLREEFKIKSSLKEDILNKIIDELREKVPPKELHWDRKSIEKWISKNQEIINEIFKDIQEEIKRRVISTNKDLREIILRIIEKYPQICRELEEYLE